MKRMNAGSSSSCNVPRCNDRILLCSAFDVERHGLLKKYSKISSSDQSGRMLFRKKKTGILSECLLGIMLGIAAVTRDPRIVLVRGPIFRDL